MKREVLKKEYTLVFKQWKSICFSLLVGSFAFFVKDGFIGALTGSFLLYTIWAIIQNSVASIYRGFNIWGIRDSNIYTELYKECIKEFVLHF